MVKIAEAIWTAGTDASDNWCSGRLEPGSYRFRTKCERDVTRTIDLKKGDRLLLDLTEDKSGMELKRHWYADTALGEKSGKPTDAWRFSLLQNRSEAGIPAILQPSKTDLKQPLHSQFRGIGDVWFDLRAALPVPELISVRWKTAIRN